MTTDGSDTYTLTVRQHDREDYRYEYVLSSPGSEPVRSKDAYMTPNEARAAGNKLGAELGLHEAVSSKRKVRR